MAAVAPPAHYSHPHTPVGSALTSGSGERATSAGRVHSASNAMKSPRLKHLRSNPSNGQPEINAMHAELSAAAPGTEDIKPTPNSYSDVQQLLHDMDAHHQNFFAHQSSAQTKSPVRKSREASPVLRRHVSPSQHQLRTERDVYHDRCQQLQQQVKSLQLAYKESATRRVQEEQAFREILKNERDRFDKQFMRLHSKIDERDILLLEWVKAIAERNTQDDKGSRDNKSAENIPELLQSTPHMKDLRNTFSLLSVRVAAVVGSAKQYLTEDDVERANLASLEARRKRSGRKRKSLTGKKKKKKFTLMRSDALPEEDEEEDDDEVEGPEALADDEDDAAADPINAFRPAPTGGKPRKAKKGTTTGKKVGGGRARKSQSDEHDDISTVTGSIMDIDDYAHNQHDLHLETRHRLLHEGDDDDEEAEQQHHQHDGDDDRLGSRNQQDAKKEDTDRILQELVDALSLEEQLTDQDLTALKLKKLASGKSTASQNIVSAASKEIEEFLALAEQDKDTDRILTEFLQKNARTSSTASKEGGDKMNTAQTNRTSMSAGTNATFYEMHITPLSTASSQQRPPMTVTGKNMEEYIRSLKSASTADHPGFYAGLTDTENNKDLEQQLQDILQSMSDITKSIESGDEFVNSLTEVDIGNAKKNLSKPVSTRPISQTTNPKLAEENENVTKLYELLQFATESIAEADAAVGNGPDDPLLYATDDSLLHEIDPVYKQKKVNKTSKSVSIKLTPEEELRQLVSATVKSTAEVTKGSAAQSNVASATRELQNVMMRSSMEIPSKNSNTNPITNNANAMAKKTSGITGVAATTTLSGMSSTSVSQQGSFSNNVHGSSVHSASSSLTKKASIPTAGSSSAKAQQMVETYLGSSDAIALMGRSTTPSRTSTAGVRSQPTSKPSSGGNAIPINGSHDGSVGNDGKYWWDISVNSSAVDMGQHITAGQLAPTSSQNNANNHASTSRGGSGGGGGGKQSREGSRGVQGGDSASDSLKLGGELDLKN